jgi:hypothetical protein
MCLENFPLSLYCDLALYNCNLYRKIRIRITFLCADYSKAFFFTVCTRAEDDVGVITLLVSLCCVLDRHTHYVINHLLAFSPIRVQELFS